MIEALLFLGMIIWVLIPGIIYLVLSLKKDLSKNQRAWKEGAFYAFLIMAVIKIINLVL